jgi:hypothetical protein
MRKTDTVLSYLMKITKLRDQLTIIGEYFDESELVHFVRMLSKVGAPMVFSLFLWYFLFIIFGSLISTPTKNTHLSQGFGSSEGLPPNPNTLFLISSFMKVSLPPRSSLVHSIGNIFIHFFTLANISFRF